VNKKSQDKFRGAFIGAAIGDALGFITEFMRNSNEIRRQFQLDQLDRFVDWERITTYYKAGNKNYIKLPLSSGTYSDDTQLTMATARSIKADCSFNPETFSKLELPLWLQYELGGGSGTIEGSYETIGYGSSSGITNSGTSTSWYFIRFKMRIPLPYPA
jgi:ADP-ribosylglycohydrolase